MDILKFNVSGASAFFKKPDVNAYRYLTYGQLHKVALMGLVGAILGLKGYIHQGDNEYPEFYDVLKNIKVAIVPKQKEYKAGFNKQMQIFNNSIGFCNKDKDENPTNLLVQEQWLLDVSWDIYIICDNEYIEKLKYMLENKQAKFLPYLGKNDHFANIKDIEYIPEVSSVNLNEVTKINSLFDGEKAAIDKTLERKIHSRTDSYWDKTFLYKEFLPYELDKNLCYISKKFVYTDKPIKILDKNIDLYRVKNDILYFF